MSKPNRHAKTIDRIKSAFLLRSELSAVERTAKIMIEKGDRDAIALLDAVAYVAKRDSRLVFMDFCPGGVLRNRLDLFWKAMGNCTFEFYPGDGQLETFNTIVEGDYIVLKKTQQVGETMRLYGRGRVHEITPLTRGGNILHMDWVKPPLLELQVPLMDCAPAVNIVETARLEAAMPEEFWEWLRLDSTEETNMIERALAS